MPLFHYKIIDKEGKEVEGRQEAKDRFDLYRSVKEGGNTVAFAEEIKDKESFSFSKFFSLSGGVGAHDKIIFARNLSKMIDAGLPMTRALSVMEKEAKSSLKKILINLDDSINKGNTLSDSMKAYPNVFSQLFISMVKAGEESGNLSLALQNVALQLEKSYQLNKKIKGALMYPAVIVSLMIIIGVLMMIYMVPTLTATFTGLGVKLPLATRIIIATSNFLVSYIAFVILGFAGLVVAIFFALKTKRVKRFIDWLMLKTPIIGPMNVQINSARTARTMSSLISSGVDIVIAASVTRDVLQNSYYKEVLDEIQIAVQKGVTISSILLAHKNLYPVFVSEMASVGEETGKTGDMLMSVALYYEEEIDQKTKDMSSIIEPVLMVIIGIAVGIFAISIIGPIYSIGDSIK